jgi:hypothetical protein
VETVVLRQDKAIGRSSQAGCGFGLKTLQRTFWTLSKSARVIVSLAVNEILEDRIAQKLV